MRRILTVLIFLISFSIKAQTIPDLFNYRPPAGATEYKLLKSDKHYDQYLRRLLGYHPVTGKEVTISMYLHLSKAKGPRPLVVVVPPIEGLSFRERFVANEFTKRGAHVAVLMPILDSTNVQLPTYEFQDTYLAAIAALRSSVDDLSTFKEIDKSKIILWASSLGAIISSTAFAIDKRFKTAIFILGAGNIPDVMSDSRQSKVVAYRKARMKAEGLDKESFRKKLWDHFVVDPIQFAGLRSKEDVFMVMTQLDTSVPYRYQQDLWNAFGKPKRRLHAFSNHVMGLILSHTVDVDDYARLLLDRVK